MGLSGAFPVARADRPPTEFSALKSFGAGARRWVCGGWQIPEGEPGGDPDSSILDETGAPVLICHVVESDFVAVQAASPAGRSRQCALAPMMARDYGFPEEWIGDPDRVAEQAAARARAAVRHPSPAELRAVLTAEGVQLAQILPFRLPDAPGFRCEEVGDGVDGPETPSCTGETIVEAAGA